MKRVGKWKSFVSFLLTIIMVLSMSMTGFAAETDSQTTDVAQQGTLDGGSITINDAVPGQTYHIYQLLYLESYDKDTNAYSYKANTEWEEWLKEQTEYVIVDTQGYVTWKTGARVEDFAKVLRSYLVKQGNAVTPARTETAPVDGSVNSTVIFENLKLGYYLVDTTLGTLCSLNTTDPSVIMEEKNERPSITKHVQGDSDGQWEKTNDADIGQTIEYRVTITVQTGAENYVLHDTMSEGLTFGKVTRVATVSGGSYNDIDPEYYKVEESPIQDGCTFEVAFDNNYIAGLTATTKIAVFYTASLNENAQIGFENGNPNTVYLQYGDINDLSQTPDEKTITYTWDMEILKYANNDKAKRLADAKFILLNGDKTKAAAFGENNILTGWALLDDCKGAGDNDDNGFQSEYVITTNAEANVKLNGLNSDVYYLREIKAPDGYNQLSNDVQIVITGDTVKDGVTVYKTAVAEINNNSGTLLPSTGGIGTTIFYVIGGILVLAAVVLLITRKRMKMEE